MSDQQSKTEARRALFLKCIDAMLEHIDQNTRLDIRDRIAALALIDRVIAREKPDDADKRGSAVRKFEGVFKAAAGNGQAGGGAGRAADGDDPEAVGQPDAADPDDAADDGENLGDTRV